MGAGVFRPCPVPLTSVSAGDPLSQAPRLRHKHGALVQAGRLACQRSAGRPPVLILVCLARPAAVSACKGSVELLGGEVAVHVVGELGAGEAVRGADQRGVELLGERVAGRLPERPAGGAGGVVPERERGVEVL